MRRCNEDKWDFSAADNPSIFPIRLFDGGQEYGFCPAKAYWPGPDSILHKFKTLIYAASSKSQLVAGGINDQPAWFVDTMSWFLPMYDQVIFTTRVRSLLGNGKMNRRQGNKSAVKGGAHGNRGLYRTAKG